MASYNSHKYLRLGTKSSHSRNMAKYWHLWPKAPKKLRCDFGVFGKLNAMRQCGWWVWNCQISYMQTRWLSHQKTWQQQLIPYCLRISLRIYKHVKEWLEQQTQQVSRSWNWLNIWTTHVKHAVICNPELLSEPLCVQNHVQDQSTTTHKCLEAS